MHTELVAEKRTTTCRNVTRARKRETRSLPTAIESQTDTRFLDETRVTRAGKRRRATAIKPLDVVLTWCAMRGQA